MKKTARHGAEAAQEMLPDGVLVVRWRGVVTMAGAEAAKTAICADLQSTPMGVVSDYRCAVVAMSSDELVRIMLGGQHDLPEVPAAVVSNADMWNLFFNAGLVAAWAGRWRRICHDQSEGLMWLRERLRQARIAPMAATRLTL